MAKKILAIAITTIMVFGIFGLVACNLGGESLADYKAVKSTELQIYGNAKSAEGNYCENGLTTICQAVTAGRQVIEAATIAEAKTLTTCITA